MDDVKQLSLEDSLGLLNDLALYRQLFEEAVAENDTLLKLNIALTENVKALEKLIEENKEELATAQWEAQANHKKNHSMRLRQSLTASNLSLIEVTRCLSELSRLIYGPEGPNSSYSALLSHAFSLIESNEKLLLTTKL